MIYDNTEFIEPFDFEEFTFEHDSASEELIQDILYAFFVIITNDQSPQILKYQTQLQKFMNQNEENELL